MIKQVFFLLLLWATFLNSMQNNKKKEEEPFKVERRRDSDHMTAIQKKNFVDNLIDSDPKLKRKRAASVAASERSGLPTEDTNSICNDEYEGVKNINDDQYKNNSIHINKQFQHVDVPGTHKISDLPSGETLIKIKKKAKITVQRQFNQWYYPHKEEANKLYDSIKEKIRILLKIQKSKNTEQLDAKIKIKQQITEIDENLERLSILDRSTWSQLIQEIQWRQLKNKIINN